MKLSPLCSYLVLALAVPAVATDSLPLKLELPKPLFAGTPRPIQIKNLEPPMANRPSISVPSDTRLLSRGKPVTASDDLPIIGELGYITDGDKSGTDGSYVEFGPGQQWVQIDLGAPAKIAAIAFWHFHSQARVYHDVIVQTSNDPNFKKDVATVFNNDSDNSAGFGAGRDLCYVDTYQGRAVAVDGRIARYVRLISNGNTSDELNHYCEIEVYGEPAK